MFSTSTFWNETDLFRSHYLALSDVTFIEKNPRGYGYWLWKPIMLLTILDQISPDDYLIYLDAGCELNLRSSSSRRKLIDYCERASREGIVAFETCFPVRAWTKRDLLSYTGFDAKSNIANQIEAGVLVIANCPATRNFLKKWLEVMRFDEYRLLDDSQSFEKNYPEFIEHRHDQAIFTALYLSSQRAPAPPETHFGQSSGEWRKLGRSYPFWASRNASRWPRHRLGLYGTSIRLLRFCNQKVRNIK
jgi:hypothetical protein